MNITRSTRRNYPATAKRVQKPGAGDVQRRELPSSPTYSLEERLNLSPRQKDLLIGRTMIFTTTCGLWAGAVGLLGVLSEGYGGPGQSLAKFLTLGLGGGAMAGLFLAAQVDSHIKD